MANSSIVLKLTIAPPVGSVLPTGAVRASTELQLAALDMQNLLQEIASGGIAGKFTLCACPAAVAQASGTLTLSSASGSVGGVINGVTVTATAAGGDTASAALVAAAINASTDPLVAGIVTASASGAVVTITAIDATKTGNAITLVASGSGVTASGARLTGGAGSDVAATSYTGKL